MQELLNLITSKVSGVSADQAQSVLGVVMEFVKTKVPTPVASQIENVMNGHEFSVAEIVKGEATEKFEDIKDAAAEKFEDIKEGAKNLMGKIGL